MALAATVTPAASRTGPAGRCWWPRRSWSLGTGVGCGQPGAGRCRPTWHPRPDPGRSPEGQGWQELGQGGWLGRHHPGQAAYLQEAMAQRMAEGDRWVVEQWRRLAATGGAAKDAEAARILDEHLQLLKLAEAARMLRRLRPDVVVSWTSDPPFLGRRTYIPVIGAALAAIAVLGARSGVAMQDRAVLVVHPELGEDVPVFGSASVYGAPPDTPHRIGRELLRAGLGCAGSGGLPGPLAAVPPTVEVAHREQASTIEHRPLMVMAGQQTPVNSVPSPRWPRPSASASVLPGRVLAVVGPPSGGWWISRVAVRTPPGVRNGRRGSR
jgi:hypothetical protein